MNFSLEIKNGLTNSHVDLVAGDSDYSKEISIQTSKTIRQVNQTQLIKTTS